VIPPTELAWLKRDLPPEHLVEALVSPAIGHVEVGAAGGWRDKFALVHWMAQMIRIARDTNQGAEPAHAPAGTWVFPSW
jgi:hypothetical protein